MKTIHHVAFEAAYLNGQERNSPPGIRFLARAKKLNNAFMQLVLLSFR